MIHLTAWIRTKYLWFQARTYSSWGKDKSQNGEIFLRSCGIFSEGLNLEKEVSECKGRKQHMRKYFWYGDSFSKMTILKTNMEG
jgi:hypothetical protein